MIGRKILHDQPITTLVFGAPFWRSFRALAVSPTRPFRPNVVMATWKLRLWKAWSILLLVATTQGVVWTAKMPRAAHGGENHSSSVAEVDHSVLPSAVRKAEGFLGALSENW
jgi:hypothetical protein